VDVIRTLQGSIDRDAAAARRHGNNTVRLDVQLFLMTCAVLPVNDDVRGREPPIDLALVD
jgi:hypothetical protein